MSVGLLCCWAVDPKGIRVPGRGFGDHLENDVVFEYDDKPDSAKHFLGSGLKERLSAGGCALEAWMALPSLPRSGRSSVALYRHGRHRKFKKKPEESRETALNPAEVDAIQQWIRQNNPTLDQIDSRAAAR
jgi:hypothetical protein